MRPTLQNLFRVGLVACLAVLTAAVPAPAVTAPTVEVDGEGEASSPRQTAAPRPAIKQVLTPSLGRTLTVPVAASATVGPVAAPVSAIPRHVWLCVWRN